MTDLYFKAWPTSGKRVTSRTAAFAAMARSSASRPDFAYLDYAASPSSRGAAASS